MKAVSSHLSQFIVRVGSLVAIDEAEEEKRAERCRYLGHVPYRVPKLTDEDKARIIAMA